VERWRYKFLQSCQGSRSESKNHDEPINFIDRVSYSFLFSCLFERFVFNIIIPYCPLSNITEVKVSETEVIVVISLSLNRDSFDLVIGYPSIMIVGYSLSKSILIVSR